MIPKIIHFCWLSGDPYPELIEKCIQSWKKKLPDYEFMLWDTKRFDINSTIWTKQAFEAKKYAFASDYIRLYAVYNYGGIYLDTDVEVLKSFNDLLNLPYFAGTQFDDVLEAAIFGAEKNTDWLLGSLRYFENRPFIQEDGTLDTNTLPRTMEMIIKKEKEISILNNTEIKNLPKVILNKNVLYLFPSEYFSPKNIHTKKIPKTKKSYTIHHYNAGWLSFMNKKRLQLVSLIGENTAENILSFFAIRKIIKRLSSINAGIMLYETYDITVIFLYF
ncbi:glycosyltransferase [Tamlana sp. 2_MG-2023]|uniref:glycosyltransferase family 32 protein n=1 Tax=unclassified Tamlana TaxID=2614803 RepID=UPI0026E11685|nr:MULTISPECIES: glycosyltransferase [unclassified Tamlana]MDO6759633.1 glycosyltransferase [Tamlana sp. 2_MG-2023]MDO6791256.1 glycosyltransferase [Tamlana sp. 1_MG-2023]